MQVLLVILIPIFLLISAVKVMTLPWFPAFEYGRSGFPADPYGFTTEERLNFATLSIEYLLNNEPLDFLAAIKMDDGQPLYNERELSHMLDVKILVKQAFFAWWILLAVLTAGTVYYILRAQHREGAQAWRLGALATLGLIAAILLGVGIGFSALFTKFHELFFTGETWIFNFSDSLIRLFPLVFWQDAFIGVGMLSILFAGIILAATAVCLKKKTVS